MWSYIRKRILQMIPVLLLVAVIIFFVMRLLPGDPIALMLAGAEGGAITPERKAELAEGLGLNDPIMVQFTKWFGNALRGDLGDSIRMRKPVWGIITEFFGSTVQLSLVGLGFSLLLGFSIGIIAALKPNSWFDLISMLLSYVGISMPNFWLGLMLLLFFSFKLKWFPSMGIKGWKTIVLPGLAMGMSSAGLVSRLIRSSLIEIMNEDYIRTARAKGALERVIVAKHALRNAIIPVITMVGLQFGGMLSGAVVIETVFSRPGIGKTLVNGILWKDYPLVQGIVLFLAVLYMLVNLLIDISYAWFDPRIQYD